MSASKKTSDGCYVDLYCEEPSSRQEIAELINSLLKQHPEDVVLAGNAEQYLRERLGNDIFHDPNMTAETSLPSSKRG